MTLPCRLRGDDRNNTTFSNFEASLNVNGKQKIERLQMSVIDPKVSHNNHGEGKPADRDRRMPSVKRLPMLTKEDESPEDHDLEIDLWPGEASPMPTYKQTHKTAHIFGRVDSTRGDCMDGDIDGNDEDDSSTRKRRRVVGLPVAQR
jgi:hypothetical protein